MSQLNQMELQNLRHLIGAHETAFQKMQSYAQEATDPQVKAYFQQSAQSAKSTKQKLMSFLG
jgi:type III secretory pathway component EscR